MAPLHKSCAQGRVRGIGGWIVRGFDSRSGPMRTPRYPELETIDRREPLTTNAAGLQVAASNRAVDSLKAHPPPTVRRQQVAHEARGERVGGVEAELDELLPAALHDPGGDTIRSAGNLGGSLPQGIISR